MEVIQLAFNAKQSYRLSLYICTFHNVTCSAQLVHRQDLRLNFAPISHSRDVWESMLPSSPQFTALGLACSSDGLISDRQGTCLHSHSHCN